MPPEPPESPKTGRISSVPAVHLVLTKTLDYYLYASVRTYQSVHSAKLVALPKTETTLRHFANNDGYRPLTMQEASRA